MNKTGQQSQVSSATLVGFFILALLVWSFTYAEVIRAIVMTWSVSNTYTHGYIILPISAYFTWSLLKEGDVPPLRPMFWPMGLLFINQSVYVLSDLMGISVLQQYAAYFSAVFILLALLGWRCFSYFMFPIGFAIFTVPFGEEFVPQLQEITAQLAVYFLRLTDIPIYREGLYLYIPEGTFEVAEACSGVRFMIASVALGTLYAYLTYRSYWRRAIFILLSLLVPIIANGIRAYGIVFIGHLSDMKYATGADHLIYGWVFFGIVMFLLFLIGNFWQEPECLEDVATRLPQQLARPKRSLAAYGGLSLLIIALLLSPSIYQWFLAKRQTQHDQSINYTQLTALTRLPLRESWQPIFLTAQHHFNGELSLHQQSLGVFVADYLFDNNQAELINYNNRIFDIEAWSVVSSQQVPVTIEGHRFTATLLTVTSAANQQRQILYWYQVNGLIDANQRSVKFAQLKDKLSGGTGGGRFVAITALKTENSLVDMQQWLAKQGNYLMREGL